MAFDGCPVKSWISPPRNPSYLVAPAHERRSSCKNTYVAFECRCYCGNKAARIEGIHCPDSWNDLTPLSGNASCNCVLTTFRKYVLGLLCLPAFFFSNCFSFCFLCMSLTPPCASLPHCVLVYLVLKFTHPRSPPLCDFSLLSRHFPPSRPAFLICLPLNPHPASPLSLTLHPTSSGSRA